MLDDIIKNGTNGDVVHSAICARYEALIAHHLVYHAHQFEEVQHTRCAPITIYQVAAAHFIMQVCTNHSP